MTMLCQSRQCAALVVLSVLLAGCGPSRDEHAAGPDGASGAAGDAAAPGHSHPTTGLHGGDLIELGNEEYHAELVHPHDHGHDAASREDEAREDAPEHIGVAVHILDDSASQPVAIEAADITLNLNHDGAPQQFKLAALPEDEDPQGKSSRFASADPGLLELFHEEEIEGVIVVTINGKQYRGQVY